MDESKVIEISNANIFQEDNLILSDVNLSLAQGEYLYIIGRVGSGKTSLIKTITAELPLKSGEETVCGFNLRTIKRRHIPKLRRKIGVVFQDFQLLSDRSVYDNLLFVLRSTGWKDKQAIKQRITEVLEMVGLKFKDYKLPHQLSGGEQQRVVIARALLKDAPVILLDEATASLDVENETLIQAGISELIKNKTVVIIAHRMRTVANAHHIVVLKDGTVAEQGAPDELLARNGEFARMVARQKETGI